MRQKSTYFKVGLFVLLCVAALIAGLLFVGADTIGGKGLYVETYIDESVQGLSVGSAVLHRGVNIGQVDRITFVQTEYPMDPNSPEFKRFGRYVMVVIAIDPRRFPGLDRNPTMIAAMLHNQVSLGLRFKLSYQGITGMSYLEADYVDPDTPELVVPWEPKNIYISSTPSLIVSFTTAVDNVFQRLGRIDFEGLFAQFNKTLVDVQTTLRDADVTALRQSAVAMMDEFNKTNNEIRRLIEVTDTPAPGNLRTAIATFSTTLVHLDELLGQHEMDIDKVMTDMKILLANLRQLSDSLKDNPARLLFAAPPQKSEVLP